MVLPFRTPTTGVTFTTKCERSVPSLADDASSNADLCRRAIDAKLIKSPQRMREATMRRREFMGLAALDARRPRRPAGGLTAVMSELGQNPSPRDVRGDGGTCPDTGRQRVRSPIARTDASIRIAFPSMTPGPPLAPPRSQPYTPKMMCTMRCTSPNRFASSS